MSPYLSRIFLLTGLVVTVALIEAVIASEQEQEFDDPIAKKWDIPEDRITREQVAGWMSGIGFELIDSFQGENNPGGTGMPERWFVVYVRRPADG